MRARTLAALMAVLLLAWPVAAQEQRGTIEGTVKDTSGAVLPGVTVEAKPATAPCSARPGRLRCVPLPVGRPRRVRGERHAGELRAAEVRGRAGRPRPDQAARVRAVARGRAGDRVGHRRVAARGHQAERRQTNIRAEQVELLPKGRDFTTLVTQAPGANYESKLGGLSIDGASAGENRFIVDGIETTNLQSGMLGQERHRRLRRGGPGQVERLHRGVRRRHGRRDQRHHQERHERLARLRRCSLRATTARTASRAPTLRLNLTDSNRGRIRHVSRRTVDSASSRLRHSAVRS